MGTIRSGSQGVTLIEILLVLVVLIVMNAFAVPAMSEMLNSIRLSSATQSLVASLQLTRVEAIKRGRRVVLCKSTNGESCAHTGGWEQGWIVFQDGNNNATVDVGEIILHREQPLTGNIRLTGNNTVVSYVSYTPFGQTNTIGGAFQAGTLTVCPTPGKRSTVRQIVISSTGRVRTQTATLDDCA